MVSMVVPVWRVAIGFGEGHLPEEQVDFCDYRSISLHVGLFQLKIRHVKGKTICRNYYLTVSYLKP